MHRDRIVALIGIGIDRSNTSATVIKLMPQPCNIGRICLGVVLALWTSLLALRALRSQAQPWSWLGVLSTPDALGGSKPFRLDSNPESTSASDTRAISAGLQYRLWSAWKREVALDPSLPPDDAWDDGLASVPRNQ